MSSQRCCTAETKLVRFIIEKLKHVCFERLEVVKNVGVKFSEGLVTLRVMIGYRGWQVIASERTSKAWVVWIWAHIAVTRKKPRDHVLQDLCGILCDCVCVYVCACMKNWGGGAGGILKRKFLHLQKTKITFSRVLHKEAIVSIQTITLSGFIQAMNKCTSFSISCLNTSIKLSKYSQPCLSQIH